MRGIGRDLNISPQRISDIKKRMGVEAVATSTPPATDAPRKKASRNDAVRMRKTLSKLLPPEERARIMVDLVKSADIPASTRARLIERIDALTGVHEAPPERESTKPLFLIDALPPELSFSEPVLRSVPKRLEPEEEQT